MDSMFEILMRLPLFNGITFDRLSEIIGRHKFHFLKFEDGEEIIRAGEECTHLKSIVSGQGRMTISNADGRFRVSQTLAAPAVISPDFFFGRTTHYPGTLRALGGPAGIMQIDKADYLQIINSDTVFLFNFLNLLSVNAQTGVEGVLRLTSGTLEKRIAYWLIALSQRNGLDITMECRQRDMYSVFGVPRQSLLAALESMRQQGAIDFQPNRITVLDRRILADILDK